MGLKNSQYNMQDIKSRVEAAQLMQEAGCDADAERILTDLAKELLSPDA